jgi:hypothetical protein
MKKFLFLALILFFLYHFTFPQKPDLCISGRITVKPEFPKIGETVTVIATITNLSNIKSAPCTSKLTITGPAKFQKITRYFKISSLSSAPNDGPKEHKIRYHYKVSEMGIYKNIINVDVYDVVKESNENNNEKSRYNRVDPIPDLTVYIPRVKDIHLFRDKTVTTEVKNIGPGISPPSQLWFFLEGAGDSGLGAKVFDVPSLNPGQKMKYSLSHRYYVPGKKGYKAWIDHKNKITELDESNNIQSGSFKVYVGSHFDESGITEDPQCLNISFSVPKKVKTNEKVTIIAKVKNQYKKKSPPLKLDFSVQDHKSVTFHIPELFPNQVFDIPYIAQWTTVGKKQYSVKMLSNSQCQTFIGSIIVEKPGKYQKSPSEAIK